jgi:hypothetical protein
LALISGLFSMMEHSQERALDVRGWTILLGVYFLMSAFARPVCWAIQIQGGTSSLPLELQTVLKLKWTRQVVVAIAWDILLTLVSFSLLFVFYVQRNSEQIHLFNEYRFHNTLSIDVRLPVTWGNCMNFVTFAMMSNMVSFIRLFFAMIAFRTKDHRVMSQL